MTLLAIGIALALVALAGDTWQHNRSGEARPRRDVRLDEAHTEG
jgi:hypothetical protein